MVLFASIMPFEQSHLPKISTRYHYVAEAILGKDIPRYPLRIADIQVANTGEIRWVSSDKEQIPILGLVALAKLRELETFRGASIEISRHNVATVARIG